MDERLKSYGAVVLLFFISLFFFSPYLDFQHIPYAGDYSGSDLTDLNLPLRSLAAREWRAGRVPLWIDELTAGFPLVAEGQAGVFYPLNFVLYMIFPFISAVTASFILHFFLASLFLFLLARRLSCARGGALFASLAFAYGGFFIFRIKHINLINAAIWLPLELLLIEQAFRSRRPAFPLLGLAAAFSVQLFAGHPQIFYLSLVSCGSYAAARILWTARKRLRAALVWLLRGVMVALCIGGLTAVQVLPSWELVQSSMRARLEGNAFATFASYHPKQFSLFVNPYGYGNPADATFLQDNREGGFWENNAYIGLLPLLFALIAMAMLAKSRWQVKVLMTVLALALLFVLGKYNPLFPYFTKALPGLGMFRFHQRFLLTAALSLSLLAGFGFDWLVATVGRVTKLKGYGRISFFQHAVQLIALAVLVTDLFFVGTRYLGSMPSTYLTPPPTVPVLNEDQDRFRILSMLRQLSWNTIYRTVGGWMGDGAAFIESHRAVLPPDLNAMYGIDAVDDRDWTEGGLPRAPLVALWGYLQGSVARDQETNIQTFPPHTLMLWGMQNVKYFLSFFTLSGEGVQLARQIPVPYLPAVKIYRNEYYLPRAYGVARAKSVADDAGAFLSLIEPSFDPSHEVIITEQGIPVRGQGEVDAFSPGEVVIQQWEHGAISLRARFKKPGYAVISQSHYPGWQAWIDERPVDILRANYAFQAVAVPEGEHIIALKFQPQSYKWGRTITLSTGGLMLITVAIVWLMRPRLQGETSDEDTAV